MYKGFVISESLNNPLVLNPLKQEFVRIEKHEEAKDQYPTYWHVFKLLIDQKDIDQISKNISQEIKPDWYAHFWNGTNVFVIFSNRVFQIPQEEEWSSPQFQEAKEYGIKNGIKEMYLDFLIED